MKIVGSMLLASMCMSAAAQTVYKSVDEEGAVSYTDRPSLAEGEDDSYEVVSGVDINATDYSKVTARMAKEKEQFIETDTAFTANAAQQAEDNAQSAAVTAERAKNCAAAQNTQKKYTYARQLYTTTADGEREYLPEDQLDAIRAEAAEYVAQWCD